MTVASSLALARVPAGQRRLQRDAPRTDVPNGVLPDPVADGDRCPYAIH